MICFVSFLNQDVCNGLESLLYLFFSEEIYRRFIFVVIAVAVTNLKNRFKAGLVPKH